MWLPRLLLLNYGVYNNIIRSASTCSNKLNVIVTYKKTLHINIQECTGHRDIGYTCTVHDLKLLLVRFARGRTFHDDTGGGGPLSNMQLVPALAHMALYVINTWVYILDSFNVINIFFKIKTKIRYTLNNFI